jgi:hypothetical protein
MPSQFEPFGFDEATGRYKFTTVVEFDTPIFGLPSIPVIPLPEFPELPDVAVTLAELEGNLGDIAITPPSVSIDGVEVPQASIDLPDLMANIDIGLPAIPAIPLPEFPELPDIAVTLGELSGNLGDIAITPPSVNIDGVEIPQASVSLPDLMANIDIGLPVVPPIPIPEFPELPDFSVYADIGIDTDPFEAMVNLPDWSGPGYDPSVDFDATGPLSAVHITVNGTEIFSADT